LFHRGLNDDHRVPETAVRGGLAVWVFSMSRGALILEQ